MKVKLFLLALLILVASNGCSVMPSPSPSVEEISHGVNWELSGMITWYFNDKNLYESYKITNQYTENRADGLAYVYDFEADCLVHSILLLSEGSQRSGWGQALPEGDSRSNQFTGGEIRKFKGTFTLIQKGNKWYRQETIR